MDTGEKNWLFLKLGRMNGLIFLLSLKTKGAGVEIFDVVSSCFMDFSSAEMCIVYAALNIQY